jgi:hypothetical protein
MSMLAAPGLRPMHNPHVPRSPRSSPAERSVDLAPSAALASCPSQNSPHAHLSEPAFPHSSDLHPTILVKSIRPCNQPLGITDASRRRSKRRSQRTFQGAWRSRGRGGCVTNQVFVPLRMTAHHAALIRMRAAPRSLPRAIPKVTTKQRNERRRPKGDTFSAL